MGHRLVASLVGVAVIVGVGLPGQPVAAERLGPRGAVRVTIITPDGVPANVELVGKTRRVAVKAPSTTMDGLTVPLTCSVPVTPGQPVTVQIAVADTSDHVLDSAVALVDGGIWAD